MNVGSPGSASTMAASVAATPAAFPAVLISSSTPWPPNSDAILPMQTVRTPPSRSASRSVGAGGRREKSLRAAESRWKSPGAPPNGRAITRPTACSPIQICSRAVLHMAYNLSSGITSVCAAIWKTLSADV